MIREVVLCKDCKYRPNKKRSFFNNNSVCPCTCEDPFYSWNPKDDWFCANGEKKDDVEEEL